MEPGFDRESVNQWSHRDLVDQVVSMAEDVPLAEEMARKLREIRQLCDSAGPLSAIYVAILYSILDSGEYLT